MLWDLRPCPHYGVLPVEVQQKSACSPNPLCFLPVDLQHLWSGSLQQPVSNQDLLCAWQPGWQGAMQCHPKHMGCELPGSWVVVVAAASVSRLHSGARKGLDLCSLIYQVYPEDSQTLPQHCINSSGPSLVGVTVRLLLRMEFLQLLTF